MLGCVIELKRVLVSVYDHCWLLRSAREPCEALKVPGSLTERHGTLGGNLCWGALEITGEW